MKIDKSKKDIELEKQIQNYAKSLNDESVGIKGIDEYLKAEGLSGADCNFLWAPCLSEEHAESMDDIKGWIKIRPCVLHRELCGLYVLYYRKKMRMMTAKEWEMINEL